METKKRKGFTLLELLVVVLIIGILAGIALPQYRVAVTKAKITSMLPLMRAWKDAYAMWKLQHGEYYEGGSGEGLPTADDLGVNWPSDWECDDDSEISCHNDDWSCASNTADNGDVWCYYKDILCISMHQFDEKGSCSIDAAESYINKIICTPVDNSSFGEKVCKTMGQLVNGCSTDYVIGG